MTDVSQTCESKTSHDPFPSLMLVDQVGKLWPRSLCLPYLFHFSRIVHLQCYPCTSLSLLPIFNFTNELPLYVCWCTFLLTISLLSSKSCHFIENHSHLYLKAKNMNWNELWVTGNRILLSIDVPRQRKALNLKRGQVVFEVLKVSVCWNLNSLSPSPLSLW